MKVEYKNNKYLLPDFLIVGAAKGGTTTLYYKLMELKNVAFSEIKEPNFFNYFSKNILFNDLNGRTVNTHFITELNSYCQLFTEFNQHNIIGEASTYYLYNYQETIQNIKELYGEDYKNLKIFIVLRNPVKRAWSHYMMKKRDGQEPLSFGLSITSEIIKERLSKNVLPSYDYIGFGKYYESVQSYLSNFPETQVILQEDLSNPNLLPNLSNFLKTKVKKIEKDTESRHNMSGIPKNKFSEILTKFIFRESNIKNTIKNFIPYPVRKKIKSQSGQYLLKPVKIPEKEEKILTDIYKEDIQKLSKLIKRDLSHWYE